MACKRRRLRFSVRTLTGVVILSSTLCGVALNTSWVASLLVLAVIAGIVMAARGIVRRSPALIAVGACLVVVPLCVLVYDATTISRRTERYAVAVHCSVVDAENGKEIPNAHVVVHERNAVLRCFGDLPSGVGVSNKHVSISFDEDTASGLEIIRPFRPHTDVLRRYVLDVDADGYQRRYCPLARAVDIDSTDFDILFGGYMRSVRAKVSLKKAVP